ncbi:hypothetical protein OFM36_34125, partial [Escherichia coli]|nr:hypothetical protein [Escherichia coli]
EFHYAALMGITAGGALLQTFSLLSFERPIQPELGIAPEPLAGIIARHLAISPLIGSRGFEKLSSTVFYGPALIYAAAALSIAAFGLII